MDALSKTGKTGGGEEEMGEIKEKNGNDEKVETEENENGRG
jgi:hypothetical protein